MRRATAIREPQIFSSMNVTPFIDVMLVLLVVLILTLPPQSHKVAVDLPSGVPQQAAEPHRLSIDRAGLLYWDARPIQAAELNGLLAPVVRAKGSLLVQTDPEASYNRFDEVLAVVKAAGITELGFVGNETMRL